MNHTDKFVRLFTLTAAIGLALLAANLPAAERDKDADNSARNVRDKNGQSLTPVDQAKTKSDIKITQQIRKEVIASKELSMDAHNVKIITTDGKVTLRGPVKTEDEKRTIGDIALRAAGGSDRVDNQLEVKMN